jgi:small subunit ribosomal protein S6
MPVYDSTFILNPQLEEGGLDARIKEAADLITSHGGKIVRENRIGMRRMAYEIQKVIQGYYVSLVFEGNRDTVDELERRFRLDEACLRFLTCHYQDFSRKRERKESPPTAVKPAERAVVKPKPETPKTPETPEAPPEEPKSEPPAPEIDHSEEEL